MSNSRKYERYFKPISSTPFSAAGTHRNQGFVGQTSLFRVQGHTPFKGQYPVGTGSRSGTYVENIVNSCCLNTPSLGRASMTTAGLFSSRIVHPTAVCNSNNIETPICQQIIVKDFSPEMNSQSVLLKNKQDHRMSNCFDKLSGTDGKYWTCSKCPNANYFLGSKKKIQEPYAKRVAPMSSSEYMTTKLASTKCIRKTYQ